MKNKNESSPPFVYNHGALMSTDASNREKINVQTSIKSEISEIPS
jgi:hypothetical protein